MNYILEKKLQFLFIANRPKGYPIKISNLDIIQKIFDYLKLLED